MKQSSFLSALMVPDRRIIKDYPNPYNEQCSPYMDIKDFSKEIRDAIKKHTMLKVRSCKVIFIGDVSVGKTTIVNRFCYDKFQYTYKATVGVDFEVENFRILGRSYTLEIWDTAGQERFKCIAQAYYRNANVIAVVFDMSKKESLKSCTTWLESALVVNTMQKPLIFLVGTKSDLLTKEEFVEMEKQASEVAEGFRAEYWTVSAKTGFKVIEFFQRIAALSFESLMKQAVMELKFSHESAKDIVIKRNRGFNFLSSGLRNSFGCSWGDKKTGGCLC